MFASPKMKGRQPYWMSRIMQHHIKPAAGEAGIEIKGWHTLRHSYTTLLRQNNGDPKVVVGLLRHSSIRITMDIYDEAMSDEKQMAHRKVLRLVTRKQPVPQSVPHRKPGSASCLFCWRPRRDLNPCYRRERAMS